MLVYLSQVQYLAHNVTSGNIAVSQGAAKVSLKAMIVGSVLNMI